MISPQAGFDALEEIVGGVRDVVANVQAERTARLQISESARVEIARIRAAESTLRAYFEQAFAERRTNFDALFTRLDVALAAGDGTAVGKVLDSIVEIAKKSPLADLGDLGKVKAALENPDHVWEL